jgi:hypothetical protein
MRSPLSVSTRRIASAFVLIDVELRPALAIRRRHPQRQRPAFTTERITSRAVRLFHPGELNGNPNPAFVLAIHPYRRDYVNPAPGTADGTLRGAKAIGKLAGDGKTVVGRRGITFYNEG